MPEITIGRLKELYRYEQETGHFFSLCGVKNSPAGRSTKKGHLRVSLTLDDEAKTKKSYPLHRLAWFYVQGQMPEMELDHINQNPADNRISNLRLATNSQNNANRRTSKNSALRSKGVTVEMCPSARYRARIKVNKKLIQLGSYESEDEAAHAYNKAAIHYFGEFACLNPIGIDK